MSKFLEQLNSIVSLILLILVVVLVWDKYYTEKPQEVELVKYLDSLMLTNKKLLTKVDSLSKIKIEKYKTYERINLKYDTIHIHIDTMPSVEATKFLLSISRQLSAKGVE